MLGSCIALILVAFAGSLLALPCRARGWHDVCGRLGQGFFIGFLLVGWCALAFERQAVAGYAWPLAAVVLVAAVFAARRLALLVPRGEPAAGLWLAAVLLVLVAAHFAFAAGEVSQQPIFGWDAWETWLYRARAMFLHPGAEFAAPAPAGAAASGAYALDAAHYPTSLTAAIVWLARLQGAWRDPAVLIAWPFAWLALIAMFVAVARGLGIARATTLLLAATLASTPILTVHAALGGYMDLWMAGYVLLAAVAFVCLARAPSASSGGATVPYFHWIRIALFAIAPLMVKIEGVVWVALLLLALALALGRFPRALRAISLVALLAVFALLLFPEDGLRAFGDRVVLARDFVRLPYLGESVLQVNSLLRPLWLALFATETFGATFYFIAAGAVLAVVLRSPDAAIDAPAHALLVRFSVLSAGFVLLLFGFTVAGLWAENHTALSRVLMQLVPVWLLAVAPAIQRAVPVRAD